MKFLLCMLGAALAVSGSFSEITLDPLPGEKHLANIRQLTEGGENAEAYFSFDQKKLVFQSTRPPHACDQVFTMNLDGALPFLLWARPTKTGERVWLWIRAGSCWEDIESALEFIASACLARNARLHRVRKLSTVVAVEIVRRDPLSSSDPILSPLAELSTWVMGVVSGEGTEAIRSVSVGEITATDPATVSEPRKGRKTTTPAPVEPVGPSVVVSGEDLSDYVD